MDTALEPGRYDVHLGKQVKRATVFEDLDAGCTCIRFDGVDRVQRMDEIDPAATFTPCQPGDE